MILTTSSWLAYSENRLSMGKYGLRSDADIISFVTEIIITKLKVSLLQSKLNNRCGVCT